jgi:hypothetical protein
MHIVCQRTGVAQSLAAAALIAIDATEFASLWCARDLIRTIKGRMFICRP